MTGINLVEAEEMLQWGGPGYDPALTKESKQETSRYTAQFQFDYTRNNIDTSIVQIFVDSKKSVDEVGEIDLVTPEGRVVKSKICSKAMRHLTAPWICSFQTSNLKDLVGVGKIITFNRSKITILEDKIDFNELQNFLNQNKDKQ